MKSKRFIDYHLPAGIVSSLLMGGGYIVALWFYQYCIKGFVNNAIPLYGFILVTCMYLSIGIGDFCFIRYFSRRSMSWLSIKENNIVWRCPLYRTVKLKAEDCLYAKIVDMNDHQIAMPVIRGDELSYIYLSITPYPPKYKHKADVVKCKKGTIIFAYSDKLCQCLIDLLPQEKTTHLREFYNMMQAQDRIIKQKKSKK